MTKLIIVSIFAGVLMLGLGVNQADAAYCGARGGTRVTMVNTNYLSAGQFATLGGMTGGNGALGNIGPVVISSGSVTNINTQTVSGNTNSSMYAVTSPGGATNTTTVINSAPFVSVCTSAAN